MFLSDNSSPLRGHVPEQAATWPGQPVPGTAAAASRLGVGAVPFLGSPTLAEKCFINNRLLRERNKGRPALHSQESRSVPCCPWALVPPGAARPGAIPSKKHATQCSSVHTKDGTPVTEALGSRVASVTHRSHLDLS